MSYIINRNTLTTQWPSQETRVNASYTSYTYSSLGLGICYAVVSRGASNAEDRGGESMEELCEAGL